jgi:outer membrane receptor protein involved in Fe transport
MDSIVVHEHSLSLYAQDSFRVTPRLTLDYGVRWDYDPAPTGANGKSLYVLSPFDPGNMTAATLAPAETPIYEAKKNAFAPRIGASYQLRSQPGWETVLRGSYGLFYDSGAATGMNLTYMFPYQRSTFWPINGPWMEVAAPVLPTPDPTVRPYGGDVAAFPNYTYPRTHQWNFAIQQAFGGKQSLTASYVGSAGRHLIRQGTIADGSLAAVSSSWVHVSTAVDTSDYHGLQLNYVRQLSHGLQAMANYTLSKSLDTSLSEGDEGAL